jgi:methionyl-tRNA formyltransferase
MKPVEAVDLAPGELALRDETLMAGAAQGTALALEEVQMEAKPRMAGAAFARDFQVKPGERIG